MVNRQQIENALKIALDDLVIDDDNIKRNEIDDVQNEFLRLLRLLRAESEEGEDEDDEGDQDEV